MTDDSIQGTDSLALGEPHPMSHFAYRHVVEYVNANSFILEALASTALEGNRCSEICHGTLSRLLNKQPVSDRYIMGLWIYFQELEKNCPPMKKSARQDRKRKKLSKKVL